jgi:hypothetical protein
LDLQGERRHPKQQFKYNSKQFHGAAPSYA